MIERGGVYYNVPGPQPRELLAEAIKRLPPALPVDPKVLYREVLERETLMSTAIGRGIALPHPRRPILSESGEPVQPASAVQPVVSIIFPAQSLDWDAPDGRKVHTAFLLLSSSEKQHLNTLSKINFLCQQEPFYALIKDRAPVTDIIAAVREAEAAWAKKSG